MIFLLIWAAFFGEETITFSHPEELDLYGIYTFEISNDSIIYYLHLDLCRDYCYTIDTLSVVKHKTLTNNRCEYLSNDNQAITVSDIQGKYSQSGDTLLFINNTSNQMQLKVLFLDSINIIMVDCMIDSKFKNKIGHKWWAFYSNHECGNSFSYCHSTKWYYTTSWDKETNSDKNAWKYVDSLTDNCMDYYDIIYDNKQIKRYFDQDDLQKYFNKYNE